MNDHERLERNKQMGFACMVCGVVLHYEHVVRPRATCGRAGCAEKWPGEAPLSEKRYGVKRIGTNDHVVWCLFNGGQCGTRDQAAAVAARATKTLEEANRVGEFAFYVCEYVQDVTKAVPVEAEAPTDASSYIWGYWARLKGDTGKGQWLVTGRYAFAREQHAIQATNLEYGPVQRRTDSNPFAPAVVPESVQSCQSCKSCRAPLGEHPLTDDSGRVYCEGVACWPEDHKRAARGLSDALQGLSCDSRSMEPYGPKPSFRGFPFIPPDVQHLAFSIFAHELRADAAVRAEAALADQARVDAVLAKMWERAEFTEKRKDCEARAEAYVVEMGRRASGGAQ